MPPVHSGMVPSALPARSPPERGEIAAEPLDLVGGGLRGGGKCEGAPEDEGASEDGCGGGGPEGGCIHGHGRGPQNE